jgi:hypothetical protein
MASYQDNTGRTRHVEIDVPAVERVRSRLQIDLYDLIQLGGLTSDVLEFLRLTHCLSAPEEEFAAWWKHHTGDAADAAVNATIEALTDFFPTRLASMVADLNAEASRTINLAMDLLESEYGVTSGASAAQLESIPLESPSASSSG